MIKSNSDMISGYLDGLDSAHSEMPEIFKIDKSVAYRHGWLNGRDDRKGIPREPADVLRRRAAMIKSASD